MPSATKPARPSPRGATRRDHGVNDAPFDRWLNRLVSVFVTTAVIVGGLALLVMLLF